MVVIKKESSPEPPRHRPTKLNLSKTGSNHVSSSTPRTAMTMREVGMACLSPGLNVTDDIMREQLERSMGVRDQQRQIIETRLQRNVHGSKDDHGEPSAGFSATRGKRKPPGGLSIVPPHHTQFATERVIHSAPLNQSFTVRRGLAEARADRMTNRLPPIADVVFGSDVGDREREREHDRPQLSSQIRQTEQRSFFPPPPMSGNNRPDYPSPMQLDKAEKAREYKSAEEAVASMAGGREDLLPRIVHYGGHQPPTPPSPTQGAMGHSSKRISSLGQSSMKTKTTTLTIPASAHEVVGTKRRRTRGDFDRDDSTGSENDTEAAEAKRRKKERFLALCSEAWDLLHS
ncbi:hypothetical protein DRE_06226 [Drechslerella stenobrocha 248]|uniref:Uncharacterized protein n=1 Tax=Drechslerella stenobrocha 248 TaxID=1043628 RepID=W7HY80_9PEZI|nr:hypothetical protein DRE_06226 [Drechslerella stenobrocha 248]